MEEAVIEDVKEYASLLQLFTRELKEGARSICQEHVLVSLASQYMYNYWEDEIIKLGKPSLSKNALC